MKGKIIMAQMRNCEHKSHLTAIGSSLRFIGMVHNPLKPELMRLFNFPLHVEEKGNDIIAYYDDDFYSDDLRFISENCGGELRRFLESNKVKKNVHVVLSKVLPERLPWQFDLTWEELYNKLLESTMRDENGKGLYTKIGKTYVGEDTPAVVKVYSANEFRTNGHF